MKTYTYTIILPMLFVCILGNAQVKTKIYKDGIPSLKSGKRNTEKEIKLSTPAEFEGLLKNQKLQNESRTEYSNKFAIPVPVTVNILKDGTRYEEGDMINYSCTLIAEGALNLSAQFSDFFLSPHALLKIFTDYELTDDIGARENNSNNIWATRIYQGSLLRIQLKVPKKEEALNRLIINQVGWGFRKVGGEFFGNPGASANCNINVLCPEGNGWENERNAVALIVSNNNEICTGTLVMNTSGTNKPYLLTANHCLADGNVANWVFQFQTWSNTCTPDGAFREDVQFNGCQLRANNEASDFALVELNQIPDCNSGITYAGWTRDANAPQNTTGLHHPRGDLMKFSHDFNPPIQVAWEGGDADHWRAAFDQGIVQHGSSGSALFDENHRIVGQLHGNQVNICAPADVTCWCINQIPSIGEYGRFDISWTGGGTDATRLSTWLDPNNTNAMQTNTTNIANLVYVSGLNITGNDVVCSGASVYNFSGPPGATVTWSVSNPSVSMAAGPDPLSVSLSRNDVYSSGQFVLSAHATYCGLTSPPVNRTLQLGVPSVYNGYYTSNGVQYGLVESPDLTWDNQVCYTTTPTTVSAVLDIRGATSINWQKSYSSPSTLSWGPTGNGFNATFKGTGQQARFLLTATNSCGTLQKSYGFESVLCSNLTAAQNTRSNSAVTLSEENIHITPNPANHTVTISFAGMKENVMANNNVSEVRIFDVMGRLQKYLRFSHSATMTIDVSQLRTGIYFVEVVNNNNHFKKQLNIHR